METKQRPDSPGRTMDWVVTTSTAKPIDAEAEDYQPATSWDCDGQQNSRPTFVHVSESGTSETAETSADNTSSSCSDGVIVAASRPPPQSTAKVVFEPQQQQQPPQEIRPYDVLISGHHIFHTDAKWVYDNVVRPERSHDLDVRQVKADIRDALQRKFGYSDIPLPTFWIPASQVENEQKNAWKGMPGTKRTLLVGVNNESEDVYEASDEWIVEENYGNSNRSPNKGSKRKIGGTNGQPPADGQNAAASLSSFVTGEDSPQPKHLPVKSSEFTGRHVSDGQTGRGDMSDQQLMQRGEDLAMSVLLREPGEVDGTSRFEETEAQSNATLEEIILQKIADGDGWAGSNMIRRACFVGFEDDVRKIREWNLTKEVYTNRNDEIRAQHFRQLEMRFSVLLKDLYEDMLTRAFFQESQATISPPDDNSDDSPNDGDTEDSDPRDYSTYKKEQYHRSNETSQGLSEARIQQRETMMEPQQGETTMEPNGETAMASTSVIAAGESVVASQPENSSLLRNNRDKKPSRDNKNRKTAHQNDESMVGEDVLLWKQEFNKRKTMVDPNGKSVMDGMSMLADGESRIATPQVNSSLIRNTQDDKKLSCDKKHRNSEHQRSDAEGVLLSTYNNSHQPNDEQRTPEVDEKSIALVTSATERFETLDISPRTALAPSSPSSVRSHTASAAADAVAPLSPPPPRPSVDGIPTGSSGSSSLAYCQNQGHSSGAFLPYPSSGSASEYTDSSGDSGEKFKEEAADAFHPEDSVLNSILLEQFQNSIIRLPFVPAKVTGQDMTVEPSIEPQVPTAVAPISLRHVAHDEDGDSMVQTPTPTPNSTVHNPLQAGTARGGLQMEQLNELCQQGFPIGLALEVSDSHIGFPVHFWSIDNGSTMNEGDCKQVKFNPDGRTTVEKCSRWTELQGTIEDQIRLSGLMNVNSLFCLRNGETGNRKFSVADPTSKNVENDVKLAVRSVKESSAHGATPIFKHLREFTSRVKLLESTLRKQNQKAVCIFSMGSLPTKHDHSSEQSKQLFVDALEELDRLPVRILIRLCTRDEHVTEFYNNLTFLGLPLVVIDDFLTEAKKVYENNPWLNYPLCLHRSREMGYHNHIFSSMTKRRLDKDELYQFLVIVFGKQAMLSAPNLHMQWNEFYEFMSKLNQTEGNHWKAHTGRVERWIDLRKMHRAYRPSGGLLTDMLSPFRRSKKPTVGNKPSVGRSPQKQSP